MRRELKDEPLSPIGRCEGDGNLMRRELKGEGEPRFRDQPLFWNLMRRELKVHTSHYQKLKAHPVESHEERIERRLGRWQISGRDVESHEERIESLLKDDGGEWEHRRIS